MGEEEVPKELQEYKKYIRRFWHTVAFDPERGHYRAVSIRIEYPKGQYHDILIPEAEYSPRVALERVKEWVERYGVLLE